MAKNRVHFVRVKVSFDKPVGERKAAAAFRDCVHGEFYPTAEETDGAESFVVRSVVSAKRR